MSSQTSIHFFPKRDPDDLKKKASEVLAFLAPTSITAGRQNGPDTSWRDRQNFDADFPDYDFLGREVSESEAIALYQPGKFLLLDIDSPVITRLVQSVHEDIAIPIRGAHWPTNLGVHLDPHDVFEEAGVPKGKLFARPSLSIKFWGYSTPTDFASYRLRVLELPGFVEIKQALESILGPVECQIYM